MQRPMKSREGAEDIYNIVQSEASKNFLSLVQCGVTYPSKNYQIKRDRSLIMCIEYVESGDGVICTNNERYYPCGGDTYMLQPGENQHYWASKKDPWKKYWINIKGNNAKKLCEMYGLTNLHHFPGLDLKADFVEFIDIVRNEVGDNTGKLLEIINRMMFKMYQHNSHITKSSPAMQIKDYIDLNASKEFSIYDIQKRFNKSESQIIRTFKNEFGITPYAYYLESRIEIAKNLLVGTSLMIKEIAANLNFYDEYYFSNLFLKKTGYTPSQYRKRGEREK